MEKLISLLNNDGMKVLIVVIVLDLILGILVELIVSYLITCGIVKLICLCFGLTFTWLIATGIWLLIILLRYIFK